MQKESESKKKILIVDDEIFIRNVLSDILKEDMRYEIFMAKNGSEAIKQVELHRPDIVLLDYVMPDMSGLEVLRVIKSSNPKIIVIILTGRENERTAIKLMVEGASDYVSKSDNVNELHSKIDKSIIICNQEFRIDELENRFSSMLSSSKKISESWENIRESCFAGVEHECMEKLKLFDKSFNEFIESIKEE